MNSFQLTFKGVLDEDDYKKKLCLETELLKV